MTPKRPRDLNQLAKSIIDIATGQTAEPADTGLTKRARAGGAKGGPAMLEQWELSNFKPEYQFVVRQYAIGKGTQ